MMSSRGEFVITVAESDAGQRFDRVVSFYRSDCSRSFAATLIQDGRITIQNNLKKPGYRVKPGEKIQGCIPAYFSMNPS
ncbi:S4 domain-containing protein, partial [Thermodesulfobacteriota bacterium]